MTENQRAEKAKALRYKKPIATNLNLWQIQQDLEELQCETARVGLRGRAFEWSTVEEETKK